MIDWRWRTVVAARVAGLGLVAAAAASVVAGVAVASNVVGAGRIGDGVRIGRFAGLTLALSLVVITDDPAHEVTSVTPSSSVRRRCEGLVGAGCVVVAAWVACLALLDARGLLARGGDLSVQSGALGAVALVLGEVCRDVVPDRRGSSVAAPALLAAVGALWLAVPAAFPAEPGSAAWGRAHTTWWRVLVMALLVLSFIWRQASRPRRKSIGRRARDDSHEDCVGA